MSESPLTRRFPGVSAIPRIELGSWPTPVSSAPTLAEKTGAASLWVKHDDISAGAYGGNKVRKLEFLLADALRRECGAVITFGAFGSNHALATAVHAARFGLPVHAVLMPQPVTSHLRATLLAYVAAGATLHPADSFDDALRIAAGLRAELRRAGIEPAVIPFGGTNALGTLGFINAAFELAEQIEAGVLPAPDVLYAPLGSMGTAAGLAIGLAAAGIATRVQAVRVVPASPADPDALSRTVDEAVAAVRAVESGFPRLTLADLALDVREGFLGEGYAQPTPAGMRAAERAAACGIALESTYTGKTLSAVAADAAEGRLGDAAVLFWNTYNSRAVARGDSARLPDVLRELADAEC